MKAYMKIYLVAIGCAAVIAIISGGGGFSYETGFTFGLVNLLISALFFVIALILLAAGSKEDGKELLIACGLILLTGGITCSIFPLKLNG